MSAPQPRSSWKTISTVFRAINNVFFYMLMAVSAFVVFLKLTSKSDGEFGTRMRNAEKSVKAVFANPVEEAQKIIGKMEGKSVAVKSGQKVETITFSRISYDVKKSDSLIHPYEATIEGSARELDDGKEYGYDFKAKLGYVSKQWQLLEVSDVSMLPLDEVRDNSPRPNAEGAALNFKLKALEISAPQRLLTAFAQGMAEK